MSDGPIDTTALLKEWSAGDASAFDRLFPRVYEELRSIAHRRLVHDGPSDTVPPTVLVHEAYLKLVDAEQVRVRDRAHFLAMASRAMRFILVDRARKRSTLKRGAGQIPVTLDEGTVARAEHASNELLSLDEALERLMAHDEKLGRVVECRFFGGMEYTQIAEAMDLSLPTVKRYWARARIWLYDFMTGDETGDAEDKS